MIRAHRSGGVAECEELAAFVKNEDLLITRAGLPRVGEVLLEALSGPRGSFLVGEADDAIANGPARRTGETGRRSSRTSLWTTVSSSASWTRILCRTSGLSPCARFPGIPSRSSGCGPRTGTAPFFVTHPKMGESDEETDAGGFGGPGSSERHGAKAA